jgi:hypothetical protein
MPAKMSILKEREMKEEEGYNREKEERGFRAETEKKLQIARKEK